MKCCKNCFWSFTPEDEEYLEGYSEEDPNRPQAGDCVLGQMHNNDYYCEAHQYIDGMEEYKTYIFYDKTYLGPGYFIIQKIDDEIIRFMKIYILKDNGFPEYSIRAYEKNSYDKPEQKFKKIAFKIDSNEILYDKIRLLLKKNDNIQLQSTVPYRQGKNNLKIESYINEAYLIASKEVHGVKEPADYIDIIIGDNNTSEQYMFFNNFYNILSRLSIGELKEDYVKKLLLE